MKRIIPLLILSYSPWVGIAAAADTTPYLCSTVTYQAFGEEKKTVKECYDSNTEMFFIRAKLNNYALPILGVSLNIPSWVNESTNNDRKTVVGQVTKKDDIYFVRVQIDMNGKNIIASSPIKIGSPTAVTVNGDTITLSVNKQ